MYWGSRRPTKEASLAKADQVINLAEAASPPTYKRSTWLQDIVTEASQITFPEKPELLDDTLCAKCSLLTQFKLDQFIGIQGEGEIVLLFAANWADQPGDVLATRNWFKLETHQRIRCYLVNTQVLVTIRNNFLSKKEQIAKQVEGVSERYQQFIEIVESAVRSNASDIHFCIREPSINYKGDGSSVAVLFRINGRIIRQNQFLLDHSTALQILTAAYQRADDNSNSSPQFIPTNLTRASITIGVNVGTRDLPGDSLSQTPLLPSNEQSQEHHGYSTHHQKVQLRWQSLPALGGYDVITRLLWQSGGKISKGENLELDLIQLGYLPQQAKMMSLHLRKTSGGVLFCGPTGSGKTTTLYTGINHLARPDIKVVMAEDPVECKIYGVSQTQVAPKENKQTGLKQTKEQALSEIIEGFLRADPDICVVSEIRAADTASGFEQLVLTGHLTLSTLHTESAIGAFFRLNGQKIGMDLETLTLPGFLSMICHQRLLRTVCPYCSLGCDQALNEKIIFTQTIEVLNQLLEGHVEQLRFSNPAGCPNCFKGEGGRTVCASILIPDYDLLELIRARDNIAAVRYFESLRAPLWYEGTEGKTAEEVAFYKMSQGFIDPREVEIAFQPFELYLDLRERQNSKHLQKVKDELWSKK